MNLSESGAYAVKSVALITDLLERANDLVAAIDPECRFVAFNAAFSKEFDRTFGKPPSLGQPVDEELADIAGDREKALALCQRAVNGESFQVEEELGVGGERRWFDLRFSPIVGSDGRAIIVAIFMRDVTQRRVAEGLFAALLEATPDAMLIMSSDGKVHRCNSLAERMFGYRRDELLGKSLEVLLPARFRRAHREHRRNFLLRPRTRPMGGAKTELVGLRADGTEFPVDISLSPLLAGSDQLVAAAIRDVTARQRALEDLERRAAEDRRVLAEREAYLRSVVDTAIDAIIVIDENGTVETFNPATERMFGFRSDEVLGQNVKMLMPSPYREEHDAYLSRYLRTGEKRIIGIGREIVAQRKDGSFFPMELAVSEMVQNGRRKFTGIIRDISGRKQAEQQLQEAKAQLTLAAEVGRLGFWTWDPRTEETYFSPEWKKLLGYEDHEIRNHYAEAVERLHPEDRKAALAAAREFWSNPRGELKQEFRLRHRNGRYLWIVSRLVALFDERGQPYRLLGTHLDNTEHKEHAERMRQIAQHDPLTGLPNRALLHEFGGYQIAAARRSSTHLAVLFIDLDDFKPINDKHGHETGDVVLHEVARRLCRCVRGEDIVARLGGDEFVVVLGRVTGEPEPAAVARNIIEAVSRPYHLDRLELSLSLSMGIAMFPRDGDEFDMLLRRADAAMYQAKQSGRAQYRFYSE